MFGNGAKIAAVNGGTALSHGTVDDFPALVETARFPKKLMVEYPGSVRLPSQSAGVLTNESIMLHAVSLPPHKICICFSSSPLQNVAAVF